jgi:SAM-dependent methyltransferase
MDHDWALDELAHAGPEHLDAGYVAGYDAKSGFDPAPDLASLRAHGLDAHATLVDLGAGTGRLSRAAAPVCRRVVAVDVSPAMLAALRAEAERSGLANVEYVHAGFLSYEHTGSPADFVVTRNALHQIPDFWKAIALDRIGRVLRPGGILLLRDLVYDFRPAEAESVFEEWFDHAVTDPARGYTRADFVEHIRSEHSTFRWLFEPMLTATGFEILDVEYSRRTYARYLCRNVGER